MHKIQILVDGRWFDSYHSGVSTYIKGLYSEIAKDPFFSVTIVGSNTENLKNIFPENVNFIELKTQSNLKRLFYDLPKIAKSGNFDYVHFQYVCPFLSFNKSKFIVTLHDLLFLEFKKEFPLSFIIQNTFLFYFSALRADVLLTVSEYSKKQIINFFKIKSSRILVVPNGILNTFQSEKKCNSTFSIPSSGKFLLYVSRIEPRKNHLLLVKSFVELKLYEKYLLVLIGKKTIEVDELNQYLKSLEESIKTRIIYQENVSEDELKWYYTNAELFIYPSKAEGFGIPPLEAIASGVKTICSNATAMMDFSFMNKYQFDPNKENDFREVLLRTLVDTNYPHEDFRKHVLLNYSWVEIVRNLKYHLSAL